MHCTRRAWLGHATLWSCAAAAWSRSAPSLAAGPADMLIVDTHQHLWDLERWQLPWLGEAPEVLRRSYTPADYSAAVAGLNVRSIYMEVDVDPSQHDLEAGDLVKLCRAGTATTVAAIIGGRPASAEFEKYIERYQGTGVVKGVRQVLHGDSTPAGFCLQPDFVRGVQALGRHGLTFDLCLRPTELSDGAKLTAQCPDTRFVIDHCGNADPKAFDPRLAPDEARWHEADAWKRDVERLAKLPNVVMKISGIIARAPRGYRTEHLAVIVDHCLDTFGFDRVVFGGDWPVCLLGGPLRTWIDELRTILSRRTADEQQKLFSANALRWYGVQLESR